MRTDENRGVPREIRKMLLPDERVLLIARQSRWKSLFTPDTIAVTDQRVVRYSPSGFLGWRRDIEDYRYEDMANFRISKGIMFARVTIVHRFMSESLVLDGLPNGLMDEFSKALERNIRRARGNPPPQQISPALEMLKARFVRGEITREQFEEMRRTLE